MLFRRVNIFVDAPVEVGGVAVGGLKFEYIVLADGDAALIIVIAAAYHTFGFCYPRSESDGTFVFVIERVVIGLDGEVDVSGTRI